MSAETVQETPKLVIAPYDPWLIVWYFSPCLIAKAATASQIIRDTFRVGQLLSLDWKLGVAIKSNGCNALNSAFVTIFLKTIDANNQISSHSFEMTIPEFQHFSKQMNDMSQIMSSM